MIWMITKITILEKLIMLHITNQHFLQKFLSRKQYKISKKKRISCGILKLIKQKNKLHCKYLKIKVLLFLLWYKKPRNRVTHEKEAAKTNYFENLFSEANGNTHETWKVINTLLRKPKRKTTAMSLSTKIGKKVNQVS